MVVKMGGIEKIYAIFYAKISETDYCNDLEENKEARCVKNYFKVSGLISWVQEQRGREMVKNGSQIFYLNIIIADIIMEWI